ncbi:hypothetical protein ZOSMA_123G00200 [Zostera marina]|uniref:Uncharacterized protein n=1 Tax=Zostera marina TaxID=29655 RepID=A0A0K9Q2F8_ZOSMR|nr:hypothetical protein ZOSMA_123G00200 [Zostera marina]
MAVALVTTISAVPTTIFRPRSVFNPNLTACPRRLFKTTCKAKNDIEEEEGASETFATLAVVGGLVANPVIGASLFKLKTTGCGLPPGPGGALGALEGVSYLVVAGIVGWSAYTKVKTGSGLPNGPFGLLGAVEGLAYLTVLAIAVVFGLQFLDMGFIPGPLPGDQCFG